MQRSGWRQRSCRCEISSPDVLEARITSGAVRAPSFSLRGGLLDELGAVERDRQIVGEREPTPVGVFCHAELLKNRPRLLDHAVQERLGPRTRIGR
jgi:hypothetical protein